MFGVGKLVDAVNLSVLKSEDRDFFGNNSDGFSTIVDGELDQNSSRKAEHTLCVDGEALAEGVAGVVDGLVVCDWAKCCSENGFLTVSMVLDVLVEEGSNAAHS